MLLRKTILASGFANPEEALAPLMVLPQNRQDFIGKITIVGKVSWPNSVFTCSAPTFGRGGGRFRYEACVTAKQKDGRVAVVLELHYPILPEVLLASAVLAFFVWLNYTTDHRYLLLGIALAIGSTLVRSFFLVIGANRINEAFRSAYFTSGSAAANQNA